MTDAKPAPDAKPVGESKPEEAKKPAPAINSAIAVANWFIEQNRLVPRDLTHLKLQKMLFLAQGWHLAYFDIPLFEDPIEALKFGPVVPSVYFTLGSRPKNENLTDPIEGYVLRGTDYEAFGTPEMFFSNDDVRKLMKSVWDAYSVMNAWRLVNITHAKGSPWDKVMNSLGKSDEGEVFDDNSWSGMGFTVVIPVELIKSYFKPYLPGAAKAMSEEN